MALTFSEVTTPTAAGWNCFGHCWASGFGSAGMFLMCGTRTAGNDRILTTEDLVTFTYRTSPSASIWRAVAYSPDLDRAVIVGAAVAGFSDDGITWSAAGTLPETNNWSDVCWDARTARFVAVATTGVNRVMTSVDGTTWVAVAAASAKQWIGVISTPTAVISVAAKSAPTDNQLIMRATDSTAATWTLVTTPSAYITLNDINNLGSSVMAYSDDLAMVALPVNTNGGSGRIIITSVDDGANWVENTIPTPTDGRQTKGGVWMGEQFFFAKFSGFYYLTSPDGTAWTSTSQSSPPTNGDHDSWAWSPSLRKALSCERAPSAPFKALIVSSPIPSSVTSLTPIFGTAAGGTVVAITGIGLSSVTSVTFGGTAAVSVIVQSSTTVVCVTPPHEIGLVDVVVVGVGTLTNAYSFVDVIRVHPRTGTVAGGTQATITGFGFNAATAVLFGTEAVESFTIVSNTEITTVTPAHTSGVVDVTVTGVDIGEHLYTYTLPVPQILGKGPLLPPIPTRTRTT